LAEEEALGEGESVGRVSALRDLVVRRGTDEDSALMRGGASAIAAVPIGSSEDLEKDWGRE
jgi:hypothetical protein